VTSSPNFVLTGKDPNPASPSAKLCLADVPMIAVRDRPFVRSTWPSHQNGPYL